MSESCDGMHNAGQFQEKLTGIVLAGGRSRRFGANKALAQISEQTAVEAAVSLIRPFVQEIIISANEPQLFTFLGVPIVPDLHPFAGPAAGVQAGLLQSTNERNLVVACDMPLMRREVIEALCRTKDDHDAVIFAKGDRLQFFPGLYSKRLLPLFEEFFTNVESTVRRELSLYSLLRRAAVRLIPAESLPFYDDDLFFNMNTPNDYRLLADKLGK